MAHLEITDAVLVRQYIAGKENALEQLIDKHQTKIYGFIYSKIKNKDLCEDIFQDTFIKVIQTLKKGKYNEKGKFLPWVMRIAHNLVIDYFRKSSKMRMQRTTEEFDILSFLSDEEDKTIENKIISYQIAEDLNKVVNKLPEDQKNVLIMRLYQDLSFKEIAQKTDVSINTALGRMRYALANVRKVIKENNIIISEQ